MIVFGPVPSRRLGRSLGINNILPKVCTYSCAYCQVGRTIKMQVDRRAFYGAECVAEAVRAGIERAREANEAIDYLTFVPDGEPTLDPKLARRCDAGEIEEFGAALFEPVAEKVTERVPATRTVPIF